MSTTGAPATKADVEEIVRSADFATRSDVEEIVRRADFATKPDVEEIVGRVVTEVVADVTSEILQAVGERFDETDARIDRIENMLRPTIDKVDEHSVAIRELQLKVASL